MITLKLEELDMAYELLGDPIRWKHDVESGVLSNGEDDTTNVYIDMNNSKRVGFKIRHISKNVVEWRPIEPIMIDNSDEECFHEDEKLIAAFDKDNKRVF